MAAPPHDIKKGSIQFRGSLEDSPLTSDVSEDEEPEPEDPTSVDLNQLFSTPSKEPAANPTPSDSISEEDILSNLIKADRTRKQMESSYSPRNSRWRRNVRRRNN